MAPKLMKNKKKKKAEYFSSFSRAIKWKIFVDAAKYLLECCDPAFAIKRNETAVDSRIMRKLSGVV